MFSTIYICTVEKVCYGMTVPCGSVTIFVIQILIYVSFYHTYIYGRKDMCYGKTVPCGSVTIFVIQILIYVSFLPYIYMVEKMLQCIDICHPNFDICIFSTIYIWEKIYVLWNDGNMW